MEPLWVPLDRKIEDNADNLHKTRPGLERNCMSPSSFLQHDFADGETSRILPFFPMELQEPVKRM